MVKSNESAKEQLNTAGKSEQSAGKAEAEMRLFNNGSKVRIAKDEMTAWLYLKPPAEGESHYTKQQIIDFLHEKGIIRGLHESNIAAMAKKCVYEREIKVAAGKAETNGTDGFYEYRFHPTTTTPVIRPDGSADYTSMTQLQNVREGEVIAIYHHAIQGENGYTVTGRESKTKPAKDLAPLRGKGISNQDNPDVYVAVQEGKIELKDNKIDIKSVHEIQGDVDLIIGRIEFYGDVVINGSISAGVVIKSGRNITIKGTVEAVDMYAEGDIILERGIQGGKRAKVSAKGSVFADFIEHAEVTAKGSVFANCILNSKVSAQEKVVVSGKKGVIMGGYVHGLLGVEATILGNDAEVKTVVHAGYEKETYDKYLGISTKEEEMQAELTDTVDSMADLLRRKRNPEAIMSSKDENTLSDLNKKKDDCFTKLDEIRQEKEMLAAQIEKGKGAKILTEGKVYRGVAIGVEDARYIVEAETSSMKYECIGATVEATVRVL